MSAEDPTAAICGYLNNHVGSLVSNRIFRPKLPRTEDKSMPRACIVVRHGGGYHMFGGGQLPVGDPRIDIVCYGGDDLEADTIARAVIVALKALSTVTVGSTLLYWARIVTGPIPAADTNTLWPFSYVCAQVMHSE